MRNYTSSIRRIMPRLLKVVLPFVMMAVVLTVSAQQITLQSASQTRQKTVNDIELQTNYKVFFGNRYFDKNKVVHFDGKELPLQAVLNKLVEGTGLSYTIDGQNIVFHLNSKKQSADTIHVFTGTIKGADGSLLAGAKIEMVDFPGKRAVTDASGRFRIAGVRSGNRIVKITFVDGSATRYREVNILARKDTDITFTFDNLVMPVVQEQPVATKTTAYYRPPVSGDTVQSFSGEQSHYMLVPWEVRTPYQPKMALKTNLLYWATTTPNVGMEFYLAPRWSLNVHAGFNSWERLGIKHWLVQPELRYWFCNTFEQHFVGIHALGGKFNLRNAKVPFTDRFDGMIYKGYGIGAGIAYGYHLPIGGRWGMEFSIGAGYVYLGYDKYKCEGCADYLGKDKKHYFGPTKTSISLIYMIR